ncbi:hypothetical protein LT493_26145 [Streptomyces tricolor]|nr:hypothetical protein [Streptomyces tricolor]
MADPNDRTPHVPGQRQESPAVDGQALGFPEAPPVPSLDKEPWPEAFASGGPTPGTTAASLHGRWEDLRRAPELGWHGMANWVKTALGLAGICAVLILLDGATDVLADTLHRLLIAAPRVQVGADTSSGVFAVIDRPIRTYIAAHSAAPSRSAPPPSTPSGNWSASSAWSVAFSAAAAPASPGPRGARPVSPWSGTPHPTRAAPSPPALPSSPGPPPPAFALRGLSLRPAIFTHIHNAGHRIEPHIHLPAPAASGADDAPDNVHPLQKR